ncbi:MAG: hypothetical protein ACXVW0_07600 [Nocardioides sp.]
MTTPTTVSVPLQYQPSDPTATVTAISLYGDASRVGNAVFTGPMTEGPDGVWRTSADLPDGAFYSVVDLTSAAAGAYQDRTGIIWVSGGVALLEEPSNFATVRDLAVRLARTFTPIEAAQVDQLLADASAHLRELIGQHITAGTASFTTQLDRFERWIDLPQLPARAITAVTVDGAPIGDYQLVEQQLLLGHDLYGDDRGFGWYGSRFGYITATVTYDYGLTVVPPELKSWALVLASQALAQIEAFGSLGSFGLQSERVDDYAGNFATGDAGQAFSVPTLAAERLRARYGRGTFVTSSRPSR